MPTLLPTRRLIACGIGSLALMLLVMTTAAEDAETEPPTPPAPSAEHVYKTTPQGELTLYVFAPRDTGDGQRPGIVFFHGGGWNGGKPDQFFRHARHLAEHGMVAVSVQYRLKNDHGTTPLESLRDALSAMRWVRAHARDLGLDPDRLAAAGGSAGGQLAAATATLSDETAERLNEDLNPAVSFRPHALVLFNPVYDNGPGGFGHGRFGEDWRDISPLHNLHAGMPPTLVMLGDQDELIPVATAQDFRDQMQDAGVRSELIVYPGQTHGFFNRGGEDGAYGQTVADMTDFLRSLGWIE